MADETQIEICECGHIADRHEIEPPCPCYECGCPAYQFDGWAQIAA